MTHGREGKKYATIIFAYTAGDLYLLFLKKKEIGEGTTQAGQGSHSRPTNLMYQIETVTGKERCRPGQTHLNL